MELNHYSRKIDTNTYIIYNLNDKSDEIDTNTYIIYNLNDKRIRNRGGLSKTQTVERMSVTLTLTREDRGFSSRTRLKPRDPQEVEDRRVKS